MIIYTHEMEESFHGEPKTCVKELFNRLRKRNIEGDEIRVLDIAGGWKAYSLLLKRASSWIV